MISGSSAFKKAKAQWETDRFSPEAADASNAMVFPELGDTTALVESDFPSYAERLWAPILPLCVSRTP